jgi:hypothetical protein
MFSIRPRVSTSHTTKASEIQQFIALPLFGLLSVDIDSSDTGTPAASRAAPTLRRNGFSHRAACEASKLNYIS